MALAERADEILRGLPRGWERARLELTVEEAEEADRAAVILAPAAPGPPGRTFACTSRRGAGGLGTTPDWPGACSRGSTGQGIRGRLCGSPRHERRRQDAAPSAARPRGSARRSRPPGTRSCGDCRPTGRDLYAEVELDSSDYLERGALLLAPVNPLARGGPGFRFRAASHAATASRRRWPGAASSGSTTRARGGRLRVLRVLSDTSRRHAGPRVARGRAGGVTGRAEPQVSWKAIEADAVVAGADGSELARVVEIAGDRSADIFDGLVLKIGPLGGERFARRRACRGIWPTPRRGRPERPPDRRAPALRGADRREAAEAGLLQASLRLGGFGGTSVGVPTFCQVLLERRAVRTWNGTRANTATSRR